MRQVMRLIAVICILSLLVITTGCVQTRQDRVLQSLGNYDSEEFYTHGGFQDYTDFGVYTYSSVNLQDNPYFVPLFERNIETISGYLDNFEQWVETFRENDPKDELVTNYVFDRSIIDDEDLYYLYEKDGYQKYGCYDLWILDSQTKTVYYFHNNI